MKHTLTFGLMVKMAAILAWAVSTPALAVVPTVTQLGQQAKPTTCPCMLDKVGSSTTVVKPEMTVLADADAAVKKGGVVEGKTPPAKPKK